MTYLQNHVMNFADAATIHTEKIIKAHWKKSNINITPKKVWKKRIKFGLKWLKFFVYSFCFILGLWGCFQQFGQPYTTGIPSIGQGLEFGYAPGTTGDWRFDLEYYGTGPYSTFSSYTMAYGPFFGWFIYPFAKMTLDLMYVMTPSLTYGGFNALITIIVLLLILRILLFWISIKASLSSEKTLEHTGAVSEIKAKYDKFDKKDKHIKMKMQQEIKDYNKKHGINALAAIEPLVTNIPIFTLIFKLVSILRPLKASFLFGIWDFSTTPFNEIFQNFSDGGWVYIFLIIIIAPGQFISMRLPGILSKRRNPNSAKTLTTAGAAQMRKNKNIQNIISIFFLFSPLIISTGVGIYYFFSALFTIAQNLIIHKIILSKRKKGINFNDILIRLEIMEPND